MSERASPPGAEPAAVTLEATVDRVVYAAPDGLFAVARLEVAQHAGLVSAAGALGGLVAGDRVEVEGAWETHGQYGRQLRVARAVPVVPRSTEGVERYLATMKHIGPESARRLVEAFGERAIDVLADEPGRAARVKGIGKKRAATAAEEARRRRAERDAMIFLHGQGISAAYAARIYKRWGDQAIARVRENPYRLAREVSGIGFQLADRIARGMGIEESAPARIEAALWNELHVMSDEGHCYAPRAVLMARAAEVVRAEPARFAEALASLAAQGAVVLERDAGPDLFVGQGGDGALVERVYLPPLYKAEVELARRLRALGLAARPIGAPRTKGRAEAELARLSDGQRRAVEMVGRGGVAVITGGPGTGKTTVMKAAVACFEEARRRVLLAAPTGRAAKRLSEATGRAAHTVHRLLEWSGERTFGRGEDNPLEADLVVVDEASMLDVHLARALAVAVPVGATLLLVGDVDQLPSVGAGQVLADVIASGAAPVARLREIFRQAQGSRIVRVAHGVLAGEVPPRSPARARDEAGAGRPEEDLFVVAVFDGAAARERVVRLVRERIPAVFGFHPTRDVQVLTPMHRGEAGTEALNRALQDVLNPSGEPFPRGNRLALRVGDKVLQTKNDYEREVWNGDIGEVAEVDAAAGEVRVRFEGRLVDYGREATDALELAYAVSVHKSQGSEYPAVVIVLLPEHHVLLRRNLLYTGITRGKQLVVIVGAPRALARAVQTVDTASRYTRLAARLREAGAEPPALPTAPSPTPPSPPSRDGQGQKGR